MLSTREIDPLIQAALKEDVGGKDLTSAALVSPRLHFRAAIQAGEDGVLCGLAVAERAFRYVDETVRFLPVAKDGASLEKGREVAYIEGAGASILVAERTAINFLGHLSGIATKTRRFVERVKGTRAKIYDTRKTIPGLRNLQKYAVRTGGGVNHRFGLYDEALIKDNHLKILKDVTLAEMVARVKRAVLKKTVIGLEVKTLEECEEGLKSAADYLLLDNMTPDEVRQAVKLRESRGVKMELEASGGITLDNVLEYALAGVERISVGELTHHVESLDLSLDIV